MKIFQESIRAILDLFYVWFSEDLEKNRLCSRPKMWKLKKLQNLKIFNFLPNFIEKLTKSHEKNMRKCIAREAARALRLFLFRCDLFWFERCIKNGNNGWQCLHSLCKIMFSIQNNFSASEDEDEIKYREIRPFELSFNQVISYLRDCCSILLCVKV